MGRVGREHISSNEALRIIMIEHHSVGKLKMSGRKCTSTISKFYDGKSVFISGATGFVGKVLIEKLLYRCSDIEKVYVLIRKTAQKNVDQRLEGLLQSSVFTRVRKENPQALTKIIPIAGDLTLPNLGIKREDEETLIENIQVVFNIAASVNFGAPLQHNFTLNVEGTERMLDLSLRAKKLQGFVHVSTAYCNWAPLVVEEVAYPSPARREDVYKFLKSNTNSKKELKKLLNGHPNTYTFTKAMAETLVLEKRGAMPTAIVRPSVVMPSLAEPTEGWVDNWQGAISLLTAHGKGSLRSMIGADHYVVDFIPVDYIANMVAIVAAKCTNEVAIYHSASSSTNPVTWGDALTYFSSEAVKNGFNDKFSPLPSMTFFKNDTMMDVFNFITKSVPAYCLDLLRIIRRKETRYVKDEALMRKRMKVLWPYTGKIWHFRSERAQELFRSLPPADRQLFPCHPADINWQSYLAACVRGVQQHLMPKSK